MHTICFDYQEEPAPAPRELFSIHVSETRQALFYRWTLDDSGAWSQHPPIQSESVELAREMVPEGAHPIKCPRTFAAEAYGL